MSGGTAPKGAVIVGTDGRAKAYRPLPLEARAAAVREGLDAYRRGDFFEAHEALEPAWMGSDDPGERAALQGLIKLAAAYVHGVRGNPPGIAKNLEGARARLAEARDAAWRAPAGLGLDVDLDALIADIDRRLADLAAHPDGPDARAADPQRSHRMTMPAPIPTIDVTEAERRQREDPARPVLVDVREPVEFAEVRAPDALLVPMSTFAGRVGRPADRPAAAADLPPRRAVRGRGRVPHPGRAHRRRPTWRAAWTPGSGPGSRSAAARVDGRGGRPRRLTSDGRAGRRRRRPAPAPAGRLSAGGGPWRSAPASAPCGRRPSRSGSG